LATLKKKQKMNTFVANSICLSQQKWRLAIGKNVRIGRGHNLLPPVGQLNYIRLIQFTRKQKIEAKSGGMSCEGRQIKNKN